MKNSDKPELKPCPFCGRPGEYWMDSITNSEVHGCKHWDCGDAWYGNVSEWNNRPIEDELRKRIVQWIKTSERVPDTRRLVIGWRKDKGVYPTYYEKEYATWYREWYVTDEFMRPTHWCELPEPPEVE